MSVTAANGAVPTIRHLIDGESWEPDGGTRFTSHNPATGGRLAEVSLGRAEAVDFAVTSAARAFRESGWAQSRPAERARVLRRLAQLVEEHAEELARLDSEDSGAPLNHRRDDALGAVEGLLFAATLPEHTRGSVYPDDPSMQTVSTRIPHGVVAGIAPWNFPLFFCVAKTATALAVGNAVVLKMAEQTPMVAARFGELALEAGLPPGLLNILHGDGETGRLLVGHPLVDAVTFTGSTGVGAEILRATSERVCRTHLELGGKSANIVCADADLDQALDGTVLTSFFNSGQICTSGARLLVHRDRYDEFRERLIERIRHLRVGDPRDPATHLGPLISPEHRDRVAGMVDAAVAQGARVLTGGTLPAGDGCYYPPTLLEGAALEWDINQQEVFGPVTTIAPFDTIEEAIAVANGVSFGLAATVWTRDLLLAHELSGQLNAGIIWVNAAHHEGPHIPYEGHGRSGLGEDQGIEAIATFTRLRVTHTGVRGQRAAWALPEISQETSVHSSR